MELITTNNELENEFQKKINNTIVRTVFKILEKENEGLSQKISFGYNIKMNKVSICVSQYEKILFEKYYDFDFYTDSFSDVKVFKLIRKIDNDIFVFLNNKLDTKGKIYLVTDGKYVKIGATSYNVKKRINELQTGNAKHLTLIFDMKVKNKITVEKHLHDFFKSKNILGEWFELNQQDVCNVKRIIDDLSKQINNYSLLNDKDVEFLKYKITRIDFENAEIFEKIIKRHLKKLRQILNEWVA